MAEIDLTSMVLNDIDVDVITNTGKTGIFDVLMKTVAENLEEQYDNNRINSTDYANVYLGSLQSVLAQSIQFALQEQLTEAQIAGALADNDLKVKQLDLVNEQINNAYTDRVLKDKQAAKLGLDNVMLRSEASRTSDNDFTYTPVYEKL